MMSMKQIAAFFIIFMMLVPSVIAADVKDTGKISVTPSDTKPVIDDTKEKATKITNKDKAITGDITITTKDVSKVSAKKNSATEIAISMKEDKNKHTKAIVAVAKSELDKIDIDKDGKFGVLRKGDNGEILGHDVLTTAQLVAGVEMIFSTNVVNGYSGYKQYTYYNVTSGQNLNIDDVNGNYTVAVAVDANDSIFDAIVRNESVESVAGCYHNIPLGGTANWGYSTPGAAREFILDGNNNRIRQTGNISHIEFNVTNPNNMNGFYYTIWRRNGTNYDRIYKSENIHSSIHAGRNYIQLGTLCQVYEGDLYGYIINSNTSSSQIYVSTTDTSGHQKYVNGEILNPIAYNWSVFTGQTSYTYVIHPYMAHPAIVHIGNSITSGSPASHSFITTTTGTENYTKSYPFKLSTLMNFTTNSYQNMGIGGHTTTNIRARFATDVVALHPDIAIIEGGVNDVSINAANDTILSNIEWMLEETQNTGIHPVLIGIMPWTNGNATKHYKIDYLNSQYEILANEYNATYVDTSSYIGTDRVGYYEGNQWDILPEYSADGVHFTEDGYTQIAHAISDEMQYGISLVSIPGNISTDYDVVSGVGKVLNTGNTCTGIEYVDTTGGTHDVVITVYFTEDTTLISDSHTSTLQTVNITHTKGNGTSTIGALIPYDILDGYDGTAVLTSNNSNATLTRNETAFVVHTGYLATNWSRYYNVQLPNPIEEMLWYDWNPNNETCNAKIQIGNSTPYTTWNFTSFNVTAGRIYRIVYADNGTEIGNSTVTGGQASIIVTGIPDGLYWLVEGDGAFVNPSTITVIIIGAAGAFIGGSFINQWYRRRKNN